MEKKQLRELKKGEWFTIKELESPDESQVWVKDHYNRDDKTFTCHCFGDVNRERFFKANKAVFVGFTF